MADTAQLNVQLPSALKQRLFVALAHRQLKFSAWLRVQIVRWLEEVEPAQDREAAQRRARRRLEEY